jgi:prepilin-type N-terminal cleavage/methylation domain-containing protein
MKKNQCLSSRFNILSSMNGFTLIELMVVMIILGFLIAIVLANFSTSQVRARDAQRKSDLSQIGKAFEMYSYDWNKYPAGSVSIISSYSGSVVKGCGASGITDCSTVCGSTPENDVRFKAGGSDGCGTTYMVKIPIDPKSGQQYYFVVSNSLAGNTYKLYARLENERDASVDTNGDGTPDISYATTNCGGGIICNYGISSTNTTP